MLYPDVDEEVMLIGYNVFKAHVKKEIPHTPVGVRDPFASLIKLEPMQTFFLTFLFNLF